MTPRVGISILACTFFSLSSSNRTLLKQERKNVFLPSVRIRPLRFFDDNDRESNNDSTHRLPFVEMTMSLSSVYDDSVSVCKEPAFYFYFICVSISLRFLRC